MKNKLDALTKHNTVVATITQEMRIVAITESIDNKLGKKGPHFAAKNCSTQNYNSCQFKIRLKAWIKENIPI